MVVLVCKETAKLSITGIWCMLNYTGRGILLGIMLHSIPGISSVFKMYRVFQSFPNGQFTWLKDMANSNDCALTL